MLNFVPPPNDRKRKSREEETTDDKDDVEVGSYRLGEGEEEGGVGGGVREGGEGTRPMM